MTRVFFGLLGLHGPKIVLGPAARINIPRAGIQISTQHENDSHHDPKARFYIYAFSFKNFTNHMPQKVSRLVLLLRHILVQRMLVQYQGIRLALGGQVY